jgi:CubicO group peptidase (beta-lactamase class C family)
MFASINKHLFVAASATLLLSGCIGIPLRIARQLRNDSTKAHEPEPRNVSPPPGLRDELQAMVEQGAPGVTAIVMKGDHQLYRLDVGTIGPETQYEVASASKWMTAALVMTVVDEGLLSLDEPISRYLPAFKGAAGATTLRELLAQTSGEGSLEDLVDVEQDPRMTLAQSAAEIAARPLQDPPGAVFKYGGPGFQVAGALVEAVTHRRWADLFAERIGTPLGMTHTYWKHLPDRGVSASDTTNPLLQGGVVTTAEDYARFLTMLAQQGRFNVHQILSAQAVDTMETAQTIGKPIAWLPHGAISHAQYALGNWCEKWTADGPCTLVSSPGAFGTFPWIDRQSGLYGIFFMDERLPRFLPDVIKARKLIVSASP